MTELHQKLMLLRPMRTGVSGFARLQWERGQAWAQLNVRGIKNEGIRAFWYSGGGDVRELGACAANARKNAPRLLAEPAAQMIGNMAADEALTPEERKALTHAFYRGFSRRMDGQTEWLRQEMERQGISMED